jgi:LysM repeat protein
MKIFFFLILFFLAFLMLLNSCMAGLDLTPNTPSATEVFSITSQPQEMRVQENPATSQVPALVPVTGGCSDPYTVRSGDTLSQIAVNCNTTLAFLKQVNPQMPNADCMYPGQQINIHSGSTVQPPAPCRAAAPQIAAAPLLEAPVPVVVLPPACDCYTGLVPVSGSYPMIIPGSGLQVTAHNFPPNTFVNVAIGPPTTGYTVVASGVTDANGTLITQITVPTASDSQTYWVVVVLTTTANPIQIMSKPFYIGL